MSDSKAPGFGDTAGIGFNNAKQYLEQSGFAGSVGTYESDPPAGMHVQGHPMKKLPLSQIFRDIIYGQQQNDS
jgi:hypothetical protein